MAAEEERKTWDERGRENETGERMRGKKETEVERRRRLRALLSQVKDDLMRVRLIIERVMMAMMMMMMMMERCTALPSSFILHLPPFTQCFTSAVCSGGWR